MHAIDFDYAPPPTRVGRLLLVPMHIVNLRAVVTINAASSAALVDATMAYEVGAADGNPFFDLRQTVDHCWLDGIPVDPEQVAARPVGEHGTHSSVRVIRTRQRARSVHTARFIYRLGAPMSDLGGAYPPVLSFLPGPRVRWSFGMADLYAGRYLEAWFPSNLPFDHFPFTLKLSITGTGIRHALVTNGSVGTTGTNRWSVRFPAWFTTMSPLVELHAADQVRTASVAAVLPTSRRAITISAVKFATGGANLAANLPRIVRLLSEQEQRYGKFTGDSYACLFHGAPGGMEYAHATTTSESALRHEVIHSWFARGLTPASQADGWWDEGFVSYLETGERPEWLDFRVPPVELCSRRPFQRTTAWRSYEAGSRVFRGIAAVIGPDRLLDAMRELYEAHGGTSVSTPALEAHLVAATGAVELVDVFHRFVYGFDDHAPCPRLRVEALDANPAGITGPVRVRVRNDGDTRCRHFVVVLTAERHEAITAVAGFELAPGRSRTMSLRWRRGHLPPAHGRLIASVYARGSDAG
jgi:hypothetical protein